MAAIDKIYLNSYDDYVKFKEWCKQQPPIKDKYDVEVSLSEYIYFYTKEDWKSTHVVFNAPCYLDAYLIKNCSIKSVQEELMLNYGYWSQKRIKEYYEEVKNGFKGWAKLEDFITLSDGTMTIKGLEKSDYERIKDGELYTSPSRGNYEYGKHFKCVKHPKEFYNKPFMSKYWFVDIILEHDYVWYHSNHNSWDFYDEFVVADWSSSGTTAKTIKALKRLMLKWKLPIGAKVRATGRYTFDEYEFIITK